MPSQFFWHTKTYSAGDNSLNYDYQYVAKEEKLTV